MARCEDCIHHECCVRFAGARTLLCGEKADERCKYFKSTANVAPKSEWISVKDRLPKENEIVLAILNEPNQRLNYPYEEKILLLFRRGYNYITGYTEKWKRPFGTETIDYNRGVTHWMPLPDAPKREGGAE